MALEALDQIADPTAHRFEGGAAVAGGEVARLFLAVAKPALPCDIGPGVVIALLGLDSSPVEAETDPHPAGLAPRCHHGVETSRFDEVVGPLNKHRSSCLIGLYTRLRRMTGEGPTMISPTIYHGGPILTADDHESMAEAVLVDDGRIVAVGTLDAVTSAAPPGATRFDLAGATMTPGLIDPHGHFPASGIMALCEVDLSPPLLGTCRGFDDVFERLSDKAAKTPKGEWVQGRMLDHTSMPEGRFPTREELDRITTDHPLWVCHISGHAAAANSAALAYLGVDRDTPDPRGGRYGRHGTTGDLDGLVEGMTAMGEVGDGEFEVTNERFKAGFAHAAAEYLAHGVTLAQNA
jgi:hypothetical protein